MRMPRRKHSLLELSRSSSLLSHAPTLMRNVTPPQPRRLLRHLRALHNGSRFIRPNVSELPTQPQPTVTNEEGTKTFRLREHGNKSLPLPPLLDPIAKEARGRHERMKESPKENDQLTDFQNNLAENPYGRLAQATPALKRR